MMIGRKKYVISLTDDDRRELEEIRNRHQKPYMRERSVAILKVAEGYSPHYVANRCLLKARDPDTVYGWVKSYLENGIDGLYRNITVIPFRLKREKTSKRCSIVPRICSVSLEIDGHWQR